jgi:uncharacterized protein
VGRISEALGRRQLIGIDTSIFIYHVENVPRFAETANEVMEEMERGAFAGVTSTITLLELAVKPLRLGRPDIADTYQTLIERFPNLILAELDRQTMRRAALLRASYGFRSPDALQLAASILHGATAFLTNDLRLRRMTEVEVLILDDFVMG